MQGSIMGRAVSNDRPSPVRRLTRPESHAIAHNELLKQMPVTLFLVFCAMAHESYMS